MGHISKSTIIFVGLARLPQPCVAVGPTLAVEVEVELPTRRILAVNSTLPLPGLGRLLREILVGEFVEAACEALLELRVRYSAPFSTAICAAVEQALQRARTNVLPVAPAQSRRDDPSVMLSDPPLVPLSGSGTT